MKCRGGRRQSLLGTVKCTPPRPSGSGEIDGATREALASHEVGQMGRQAQPVQPAWRAEKPVNHHCAQGHDISTDPPKVTEGSLSVPYIEVCNVNLTLLSSQ